MKNDIFEQCYQFNMRKKFFKAQVLEEFERTSCKVANHFYEKKSWINMNCKYNYKHVSKSYHRYFDGLGLLHDPEKLNWYIHFVFWNNHPYWAFLLLEEFDEPDFLDCAKTMRNIAYTYADLPGIYTGLINYDVYQVAPRFI